MTSVAKSGILSTSPALSVSPRVIPLFLQEISSNCSSEFRNEHIKQFTKHLGQIFLTKVTDDDVIDLIVTLIGEVQRDDSLHVSASSPLTSNMLSNVGDSVTADKAPAIGATTSFHVLCLFKHLFDTKDAISVQCFRSLRKFSEILTRRQTEAEEKRASQVLSKYKSDALQKAMQQTEVNDSPEDSKSESTTHPELWMDKLLLNDFTRAMLVELWRDWDSGGVDITHFSERPDCLHLYLPSRKTSRLKVYRDFAMCTARPKLVRKWGSVAVCHIKTNIPKKSEVMYRILVEGYNYGVNAVVFSDVVGYTNRSWDELGNLEKYGWPEGWDAEMANDYAPGVAISQYFSADGFVTLRLRAKSMYCIGFSVSAWLVFHGMGEGFPLAVSFHHQDIDL